MIVQIGRVAVLPPLVRDLIACFGASPRVWLFPRTEARGDVQALGGSRESELFPRTEVLVRSPSTRGSCGLEPGFRSRPPSATVPTAHTLFVAVGPRGRSPSIFPV